MPCPFGANLASLPLRAIERDAELQKRRTKPESKCSCEQNTPPHNSEASTLTNMYGGSCIGYLTKRGRFTRKRRRLLQGYIGLTYRSIHIFPKRSLQFALNLDHPIFRLVVTISSNSLSANQAECSRFYRLLLGLAVCVSDSQRCAVVPSFGAAIRAGDLGQRQIQDTERGTVEHETEERIRCASPKRYRGAEEGARRQPLEGGQHAFHPEQGRISWRSIQKVQESVLGDRRPQLDRVYGQGRRNLVSQNHAARGESTG
jgi:hypothetical protein